MCATVVSQHQSQHPLHRHLHRHPLLAHALADIQRNSTTATMRAARLARAQIAKSVAMAAISSLTQVKELIAWRTRHCSRFDQDRISDWRIN